MNRLPGGSSTYSKAAGRYPAGAPRLAERCDGAYLHDTDGRPWIDYVSALGAVILGHRHPHVEQAVQAQLCRGVSFSIPTRLEHELAERLCSIVPGCEMVRYGKNGVDATAAAVRVARAVTDRPRILMCEGGYHGGQDTFLARPPKHGGVPRAVRGLVSFCRWGDLRSLEGALAAHRPACFILEAVQSADPHLPPAGYFDGVRTLCDEYGALLVLDEMVTGFRAGWPGALTRWDIRADLVCFGKAIANGHPLSVLCGPRELVGRIEQDVFYSTTFGGEALSLAAAMATLDVLERGAWQALDILGRALTREVRALAAAHGVDVQVRGYPARPVLHFADATVRAIFLDTLTARGILTQGYWNLTLAHCDAHVLERTRTALADAFAACASVGAPATGAT